MGDEREMVMSDFSEEDEELRPKVKQMLVHLYLPFLPPLYRATSHTNTPHPPHHESSAHGPGVAQPLAQSQ
jgi:hypothetical protein